MSSTRNNGHHRPSDVGTAGGFLVCLLCFSLPVVMALVCVLCSISGCSASMEEEEPTVVDKIVQAVTIDTSDSWKMHSLGLPTKVDVLSFHMYGHWGFARYEGDYGDQIYVVHKYEAIPGDIRAWDELYGLDPDNLAFKY